MFSAPATGLAVCRSSGHRLLVKYSTWSTFVCTVGKKHPKVYAAETKTYHPNVKTFNLLNLHVAIEVEKGLELGEGPGDAEAEELLLQDGKLLYMMASFLWDAAGMDSYKDEATTILIVREVWAMERSRSSSRGVVCFNLFKTVKVTTSERC